MTLLQTLAILWARWFCKHNDKGICVDPNIAWKRFLDPKIDDNECVFQHCVGFKCKGCSL